MNVPRLSHVPEFEFFVLNPYCVRLFPHVLVNAIALPVSYVMSVVLNITSPV